jgi:hypothetical protein
MRKGKEWFVVDIWRGRNCIQINSIKFHLYKLVFFFEKMTFTSETTGFFQNMIGDIN